MLSGDVQSFWISESKGPTKVPDSKGFIHSSQERWSEGAVNRAADRTCGIDSPHGAAFLPAVKSASAATATNSIEDRKSLEEPGQPGDSSFCFPV